MRFQQAWAREIGVVLLTLTLGACGGGSSGGGSSSDDTGGGSGSGGSGGSGGGGSTESYSIGGTISGNSGDVVLSLNGSEETFSASPFTFTATLEDGTDYAVAFVSADGDPSCTVENGSGTVSANVSNVSVTCTPPVTTTGMRVSKIERDFDNNGIAEMTSTVTYSEDALDVTIETTYLDDGTPDQFHLGDDDIIAISNDLSFTEDGLPLSISIENLFADSTTELISFTYAYTTDGQIETITQEVINPDTSLTLVYVPEYTGGVLTALIFDNGFVTGGWSFTYDADGTLATTQYQVGGSAEEDVTYTWRADGQLESIEKSHLIGGEVSSLTTSYDGDGVILSAVHVDGVNPTYEDSNYTENFTLDADGKLIEIALDPLSTGTAQATESYSWEEGVCYQMYVPQPAQIILPNMMGGDAALFPAGIFNQTLGCRP